MIEQLKLVEATAKQGQYILRKTKELHPFAMVLDKKGKLRQLIIDWQEELPDSRELAVALEAVVKVRLKFDSISYGAICIDMMQRDKNGEYSGDFLWIKVLSAVGIENFNQDYIRNKKDYVFSDIQQGEIEDNLTQLSD